MKRANGFSSAYAYNDPCSDFAYNEIRNGLYVPLTLAATFLLFPPSFFPYKDRAHRRMTFSATCSQESSFETLPHTFPHVQYVSKSNQECVSTEYLLDGKKVFLFSSTPSTFPWKKKNVENNYFTIQKK